MMFNHFCSNFSQSLFGIIFIETFWNQIFLNQFWNHIFKSFVESHLRIFEMCSITLFEVVLSCVLVWFLCGVFSLFSYCCVFFTLFGGEGGRCLVSSVWFCFLFCLSVCVCVCVCLTLCGFVVSVVVFFGACVLCGVSVVYCVCLFVFLSLFVCVFLERREERRTFLNHFFCQGANSDSMSV